MADNREWMYSGWKRGRPPTDEWVERTKEFLDHAFSNPSIAADGQVKCPCSLCRNFARHKRQTIEMHLCREGFKENYSSWTTHGEGPDGHIQDNVSAIGEGLEEVDHMDDMLCDMADGYQLSEQEPTASAQAFYKMVASADEPVHSETQHSRLSTIARLLSIKSQYNMPAGCYDDEYRFGQEKAGGLDTYKVQMGGFKASLKGSGNITSQKVKKRIVDYTQAMDKEHGENWQESDDLDGNVIYQTFGGMKNGRFAMGNGSFKKSEVIAAAKHNKAIGLQEALTKPCSAKMRSYNLRSLN